MFDPSNPNRRWEGDGPWDRPVSVAVVGDLGLVNGGATFDRLHRLVEDGEIDFVLHLGDIGCERLMVSESLLYYYPFFFGSTGMYCWC